MDIVLCLCRLLVLGLCTERSFALTLTPCPPPLRPLHCMRISVQLQSLAALSVLCAFPLQAAPSDLHLVSSGKEVLKRPAREVKVFNEVLASTSTKMLDVMYSSGGIGLAAPQVGIDESILVYNIFGQPLQWSATENVLINPQILSSSKLTWTMPEGCLSLQGEVGFVTRPWEVEVEAATLDGKLITRTYRGVEARIVQHEIDHLNGLLFIDKGWALRDLLASSLCYATLLTVLVLVAKTPGATQE